MSAARPGIRRRSVGQSAAFAGLHPVLARVLAARGLQARDDLDLTLAGLHRPEQLGGIDGAVELLLGALREGRRILVIGDFDCDGATSTALALLALRAMGFAAVDYLVPDRFRFGYGLSAAIVRAAVERRPDLLITVDNGVSSLEGVALAKSLGLEVLVTDHHLPGARLPQADAIVNPNLHGDPFPSKSLAGVGVVFYLLARLRGRLAAQGWFAAHGLAVPNLSELLDLVALGTVADVVPLDHNNRILVEQGLRRIRAGRCRPGISALLQVAGRPPGRVVAGDLAFAVAPRLNAAGRLDDMSLGVECLLCEDPARALELAAELDELNRQRRAIEAQMQDQAVAALSAWETRLQGQALPPGLVLFDPDWHQGVIGILAGRIKDRLHRPVIAFARGEAGELKGSARSIPDLHVRDVLDSLASRYPGLISHFGGHAMAAGLGLPADALDRFRHAFAAEVGERLGPRPPRAEILTDGELSAQDFDLDLAEQLRYLAPWGQGFPEPCFDGEFRLRDLRVMGERHLKLSVCPPGGSAALEAVAFNWLDGSRQAPRPGCDLRLVYRLDVNEFRGERRLQLVVEHLEGPAGDDATDAGAAPLL